MKPSVIPGSDCAGKVILTGSSTSKFKPGDRVSANFALDHVYGLPTEATKATCLSARVDGVLGEYRVFPEHVSRFSIHIIRILQERGRTIMKRQSARPSVDSLRCFLLEELSTSSLLSFKLFYDLVLPSWGYIYPAFQQWVVNSSLTLFFRSPSCTFRTTFHTKRHLPYRKCLHLLFLLFSCSIISSISPFAPSFLLLNGDSDILYFSNSGGICY